MAYDKDNYERNKPAHSARQKKYRINHKDKERARHKKYDEENADKNRIKHRNWYLKNREKALAQSSSLKKIKRSSSAAYRQQCYEAHRLFVFRTKYGITQEDYDRKLIEQKGKCDICGRDNPGRKGAKYFAVDHDHKTGKVRGLLCSRCNCAIGSFQDDIAVIGAALEYLKRHKLG